MTLEQFCSFPQFTIRQNTISFSVTIYVVFRPFEATEMEFYHRRRFHVTEDIIQALCEQFISRNNVSKDHTFENRTALLSLFEKNQN